MEPKDHKYDIKEGRIKAKVLPLERRVTKDINQEPEMKELERMIQTGELNPDRTIDYLEREGGREMNDEIYNLPRVSEKLGISIRGVRDFIRRGQLKARLVGRRYFVMQKELDRFLEPPEEDPETPGPDFLTVSEYSKETGIPEAKIRAWLRDGILKGAKGPRGRWLINPKMIFWLKEIREAIHPKRKVD